MGSAGGYRDEREDSGTDVGEMVEAIAAAAEQLVDGAAPDATLAAVIMTGLIIAPDGDAARWRVTSCVSERLSAPLGQMYHDAGVAIEARAREEGY
jgi:hypothetical protein